jgi:hypothetical protein
MIAAEPRKFFTEPHYNGFPAVLVRLAEVSVADLRTVLEEAWRCQAPAELLKGEAGAGRGQRRARRARG